MIQNKKKFALWIFLSLIWLCVIWGHSLMPASVSHKESSGIFEWLHRFLPFLTHGLLRKIAHFSAFAILGGLLSAAFMQCDTFSIHRPIGIAFLCAFVDETIQLFVTGRSGQISDLWIDLSGACVASLLLWVVRKLRKSHRSES